MENDNLYKALLRIIELQEEILMELKRTVPTKEVKPGMDKAKFLTRQQVQDYLGISERTYIRKVKTGKLTPMKMPGGDRFDLATLEEEYRESIRRGRI